MICEFGCGKEAIKQFKSGRWCCSNATSSCPAMKLKNRNKLAGTCDWQEIQKKYNEGYSLADICILFSLSHGYLRGAINRKDLIVRSNRDGLVLSRKNGKGFIKEDTKEKIRIEARNRIIKRYEQGWMPKAGRCKKYRYYSPIAGEVLLDGTWELAVAKWLDKNKFNWRRNTIRFQYINLKNKISFYTPDFWVEELNGYLEIKGYETKLDRCKWSQFTSPLVVWKKKELYEKKILIKKESGQDGNAVDC